MNLYQYLQSTKSPGLMKFPSLFLMRRRWERQTPILLLSVQTKQTRSLSPFTLRSNLHKIFKPPRPKPNYMSLITVSIFPFFLAFIRIKWFNFCSTQSFQLVERYNNFKEKSNVFRIKRIWKQIPPKNSKTKERCTSTLNIRNVEDKNGMDGRDIWSSDFPFILGAESKTTLEPVERMHNNCKMTNGREIKR